MGMVALRISQKYLAPNARGDMRITYTSKPGEAYEQHCFMKKAYPLEMKDGKIKEGIYFSLPGHKRNQIQGLHTGFLILTSPSLILYLIYDEAPEGNYRPQGLVLFIAFVLHRVIGG